MQYKSIIWYGIGSYLTTMVVGIIYALIAGVDMTTTDMPDELWYASVLIALVVTLLRCVLYFSQRRAYATMAHGLQFGVGVVLLSFFLDAIMWLPFVSQSGSYDQLISYYSDRRFWVTLVVIIVGCGVVGSSFHKK